MTKKQIFSGKNILLVNTGSSKKRFILQRLKKLGLGIVALNNEKNWAQPYVDHWIIADNINHHDAISAVHSFISLNPGIKLGGTLTFWEDDVLLNAKVVDRFNFIGIPYAIAKKVRNKYLFRDFCAKQNLPAPKFQLIRNDDDLKAAGNNFSFPIVLKPAYGSSSAYVIKVENRKLLAEMYQFIKSNISINAETALNDGLDIFAEEYIDGDEVDIDILLQNGKVKFHSIADNYSKNKGIFFVDSGQAIPSRLPLETQTELLEVAEETLEKLGIQNGCIHFEAKYSNNKGVYPIEINMRMGGDYVYSYTKSAWGIDLIENAAKIALGEYLKVPKLEHPRKYIIGWDLHPTESGVVSELDVPDDLEKNKFVEDLQIYKELGDPIFMPPEGFEHLGWLTVSGDNLLDAQDNLENVLKEINYKVVKFNAESSLGKTERKDRFSSAVLNKNLLIRTAKISALPEMNILKQRKLNIGVLGNFYLATNDPMEKYFSQMANEVGEALEERGYNPVVMDLNNLGVIVDILRQNKVDLVFNLGEKMDDDFSLKPQMVSPFNLLGIPFTGSDIFTLYLAANKIQFKKILDYHEIPTPRWDYLYELGDKVEEDLQYPLIVKPANSDHSLGISNESVVQNEKALYRQAAKIFKELKSPVLIEEYIEGDEYEAFVLGNNEDNVQVFPLSRSIFDNLPKDHWHIYSYDAKWGKSELANKIVRQLPPKNISKKLQSLLTEIALDTYTIFQCRDYGKVEIKVDKDNNPYVIDLNPNPGLSKREGKGIVAAAKLMGISYNELLEEIIRLCVERYKTNSKFKSSSFVPPSFRGGTSEDRQISK